MHNIISALLYIILLMFYFTIEDHEHEFMWAAWFIGYSKGFWKYLEGKTLES